MYYTCMIMIRYIFIQNNISAFAHICNQYIYCICYKLLQIASHLTRSAIQAKAAGPDRRVPCPVCKKSPGRRGDEEATGTMTNGIHMDVNISYSSVFLKKKYLL